MKKEHEEYIKSCFPIDRENIRQFLARKVSDFFISVGLKKRGKRISNRRRKFLEKLTRKAKFSNELENKLEELFPKGKSQEREEALILIAFANIMFMKYRK